MPSFDIVSELDLQEVDNAINTARKEVESRYDLKGTSSEIKWDKDKKEITLQANDDSKVAVVKDILQSKMHKRGIDLRAMKFEKIEAIGGMLRKQKITLVQGIDKEIAKDITKTIRDSKLKVQAQIQDEKIRVTGKSRDDLQECIAVVRNSGVKVPLQFTNMRA
ncbi:MAG TPA: YajQ family cyclic di-GMP-binding protein [Bdellovibrionales bacterium]|nr:YajQ family cyclic di-GMP-binding protein [Bdellovibrionales bacterium]